MTLESVLSERGPMTAQELSRILQKPKEDVYVRLVHLEALGMTKLAYVKGCRKTGAPAWQWEMA